MAVDRINESTEYVNLYRLINTPNEPRSEKWLQRGGSEMSCNHSLDFMRIGVKNVLTR